MYEYLSGRLISKTPVAAVLDVNGIGYHIAIPVSTFSSLPEIGQSARLLTHFVVREDAQALYGFFTEEERDVFRLLISVSGIGPKTGLGVLSGIPLDELKKAIIRGNLPVLTGIPGIGKKTAERLVVELREKMVVEERLSPAGQTNSSTLENPAAEDSLRALVELGYKKQNAKEAVEKALKAAPKDLSVPDLIRASLKYV